MAPSPDPFGEVADEAVPQPALPQPAPPIKTANSAVAVSPARSCFDWMAMENPKAQHALETCTMGRSAYTRREATDHAEPW